MDRFRAILENTSDFIATVAPDGKLIYINSGGRNLVGWSETEDISARLIKDLHPAWAYEIIMREGLTEAIARGTWKGETALLHRDGNEIPVSQVIIAHRADNGNLMYLSTIMRDITERKRAEEILRESEKKFRDLTELLPLTVFEFDLNGDFTYINRFGLDMFGYTQQDFEKGINTLHVIAPADRERAVNNIGKIMRNEIKPGTEYTAIRKNGEEFPVIIFSTPVHADEQISGLRGIVIDNTDRKRAEIELHKSEERFRSMIQSLSDMLFVLDKNFNFIYESPSVSRILGYEPGYFIGKSPLIHIHPDDLNLVLKDLNEVYQSVNDGSPTEFRYRKADGSWLYLEALGSNQFENPGISGLIITARDITVRKEADEALKVSERNYREIFNTVNDTIWVHDIDTGKFIDVNNTVMEMFGYNVTEALNLSVNDISSGIPPYMAETAMELIRKAADGQPQMFEWHCRHKDGHLFWTEVNLRRASISGKDCILAIERDITKRKEAEEAVYESERKFRDLAEKSVVGIYLIQDGLFKYVNGELADMFGYTPDEIINKLKLEDVIFIEDLPKVVENIRKRITGEVPSLRYELRAYTTDGRIKYIEIYGSQTVFQGKAAVIGTVLDITDRKSLEDRLRQAQKMEAVGQLAGGVAHDFNNILTAILGYTEMVITRLDPDDRNHAMLMEVYRAGQRAAELTKQLLAFSRRQVLQLAPIDLNQTINTLVNMLRRLIGENIELEISTSDDLFTVNADPGQIEQVIMNLCLNARDAMPGGGMLSIETKNTSLDKGFCSNNEWARPGHYVLLSITDSGSGMEEEIRQKIFEPFFTTKEPDKGTGLGLATVYGIVSQHDGMIQVYSEPGKGSRFTIYLPAIEKAVSLNIHESDPVIPGGNETILLAEDNEQVRALAIDILGSSGYKVLSAVNGEEALTGYNNHAGTIDLLLLDVVMPKKGGRTVYDEIRSKNSDVPCLFISGYSVNAVHTNFILDQGLNLIQKPFKKEDLLKAVRKVLDHSRKS